MFEIDNYEIYEIVNILGFLIGLTFGAIAQKNQFCFSGSIKDYILSSTTKRAASVVMAIIVAIISTYMISTYYQIDLTETSYHRENINYFSIVFGGVLFGIGMMVADGCSSRHLIKFAQGDSHSLITVIFIGIFAFAATRGILYEPLSFITQNETLLEISSKVGNFNVSLLILIPLVGYLLYLTKGFKRLLSLKDGVAVGLLVGLGWYVTGFIGAEALEREIGLTSLTFVYPTAKSLEFITSYQLTELTFGITIIAGVVIGAFVMSKFNKRYSFGCASSIKRNKVVYNMIGGALMGVGGVLAIGCTVGQGLTGFSTLASASVVAIGSIMFSGYVTAKILGRRDKLPMCFIFEWEDEKGKEEVNYSPL